MASTMNDEMRRIEPGRAEGASRNQVPYGIHRDRDGRPQGGWPMRASWRILKQATRPPSDCSVARRLTCSLGDVQHEEANPFDRRVHVRRQAWPERTCNLDVFLENGRCAARVFPLLDGKVTRLTASS